MPAAKPSFPRLLRSKPLAQGLVGAWPFCEGGGLTANDVSESARDGSLNGGVSWSAGQMGTSLTFDGSTGYVQVSTPTLAQWTIAAWVYPTTVAAATSYTVFSNDRSGFNNDILFGINPESGTTTSKRIGVDHQDSGSSVRTLAQDTVDAAANTQYFVAATSDGSTLTLYVFDGTNLRTVSTAKAGTALTLGALTTSRFGANPQGGATFRGFIGRIDAGWLYSRALAALEISALIADSFQIFRPSRTILKVGAAVTAQIWPYLDTGLSGSFCDMGIGGL